MKSARARGKKLGFVVQEIEREINTMESKTHDADTQKEVVMTKDVLETIREQLNDIF